MNNNNHHQHQDQLLLEPFQSDNSSSNGIPGFAEETRSNPKKSTVQNKPAWQSSKWKLSGLVSLMFLILEVAFAAPGLIAKMPPSLQDQPIFQIAVFAGTGLFAAANIAMAWGDALKLLNYDKEKKTIEAEIRAQTRQLTAQKLEQREQTLERDRAILNAHEEKLEARNQERRPLQKDLGKAEAELNHWKGIVASLKQEVTTLEAAATHEHHRWEHAVRKWMENNPRKVRQFINDIYPKIQAEKRSKAT